MSIKAEITASMCTNKIRALAATAVDKVNWTVVPKRQKHWMTAGSYNPRSMLFSGCVFIRMINDRSGLHLNIT